MTDRKFYSIWGASSVLLSRERRCFMTDPRTNVNDYRAILVA